MSKVVFITGCSTGIGNATALYLAQKGHHVFATMRNPDCEGGKDLLTKAKAGGLALEVFALDINNPESCIAAIERARASAGRIDILVVRYILVCDFFFYIVAPPLLRGFRIMRDWPVR
jgi:NAD(P)-dependent dehydrogenase (short-subunit alcohol dehydrogenase family)